MEFLVKDSLQKNIVKFLNKKRRELIEKSNTNTYITELHAPDETTQEEGKMQSWIATSQKDRNIGAVGARHTAANRNKNVTKQGFEKRMGIKIN